MGIIEDSGNRGRLAQLLRFQTSKSEGKLVSLSEYVANMKEGQKSIYYLTGEKGNGARGRSVFHCSVYCAVQCSIYCPIHCAVPCSVYH